MVKEKRDDLERFIREQTLGPGVMGYRYIDIQDENLLSEEISGSIPNSYTNEILNNAPGALYSTGILFPIDKSDTATSESDPDTSTDDDSDSSGGAHENINDHYEESLNINQMFPNSMGLTCCISNSIDDIRNIKIKVKARYYRKLDKKTFPERFGVLLEQDLGSFESFISSIEDNDPIKQRLQIRNINDNIILLLSSIDPNEIPDMKRRIREIDKVKASQLGSERKDQYLSGYKEHLFRKLRHDITEESEQRLIADKIKKIESIENSISHINDLINIFDTRGYGLWRCEELEKEVRIPEPLPDRIDKKIIYSYKKYEDLEDIFSFDLGNGEKASLSSACPKRNNYLYIN